MTDSDILEMVQLRTQMNSEKCEYYHNNDERIALSDLETVELRTISDIHAENDDSETVDDDNEHDNEMWSSVESGGGTGAAPCARGKHSATLLGGHVYVLGGRGAGGAVPLRDFWRYCLASGRWERLESRGDPPPSLQEHSAIAHADKLYVFGGEAGALSNETPLWIYDTQTQLWRKLPGAMPQSATVRRRGAKDPRGAPGLGPRGRRGHSAHALNDCLLVYGGYKDLRGTTNELWAFHYESESWHLVRTAGAGPARHRHAAVLHDNRLYVHGGQCDLRDCADMWHYDTISRVWSQVRIPGKAGPSARSGHAAIKAGAHLYIFGGEAAGHATNELWRFHFGTETWERIAQSLSWPSPRVDCCVLLVKGGPLRVRSAPAERLGGSKGAVAGRPGAPAGRPEPPASLLRELTKLSSFHMRRGARCSYSPLGERDSTESLARDSLPKSHSAYVLQPPPPAPAPRSPRAGRVPRDLAREPISVPDFADMVLPTPVLSPVEVTKLVYLDSDEEADVQREYDSRRANGTEAPKTIVAFPKSASVRFTKETTVTDDDEGELSTSDYASAERVNRVPGASLGFSNPHYLGPDVRTLGLALTPDSGAGDMELLELARRAPPAPAPALHLLLVGGKEPPHLALLQSPISMWTYKLLY